MGGERELRTPLHLREGSDDQAGSAIDSNPKTWQKTNKFCARRESTSVVWRLLSDLWSSLDREKLHQLWLSLRHAERLDVSRTEAMSE